MKKLLIATGIAALALATVAGAQGYAFSTNLTVGSTGADVVALQTWLMANGYSIPALASGAATKGYFGAQTKAAVIAYQKAVGLPNTGFFGPLTRAKVNGGAVAGVGTTVVTCPVGYTCTPQPGTPVQTVQPGQVVLDNSDGSITISASGLVSTGQTLKKGDMDKPVIAVRAQATAGPVTVSRVDVHFSTRPWLVFSGITLKDGTGKVLATKPLVSAADATEVTVGSDYLVRFEGVNAVVVPGSDTNFVVTANVLSATDKIPAAGTSLNVGIPTGAIRTINGKGYTDSVGLGTAFSSGANTITLSGTGSTGDLYTRISPTTPSTRTENVSSSNTTYDEVLGAFDVKLQNQSGTLNTVVVNINTNNAAYNVPTMIQNVRLYDGSTLLGGASTFTAANPGVATFTNLTIPLTVDVWKTLTVKADVLATSTSFQASSTLVAASVVGTDTNYNTITLSNASNRTGNDVTFVPNAGLTLSNLSFTSKTNVNTNGVWVSGAATLTFTINNTGNNPIYISKTANVALATTSTGTTASTTVVGNTAQASGDTTGDTTAAFIVNGSRTFTYTFSVNNTNNVVPVQKLSLTQINYGTSGASDSVDNTLNINYGLQSAYTILQ